MNLDPAKKVDETESKALFSTKISEGSKSQWQEEFPWDEEVELAN